MGGRGASSSIGNIQAIEVSGRGIDTMTYRQRGKGQVSGINDYDIRETKETIVQMATRLKKQGFNVKTYNSKQLKEHDNQYNKKREKASKELDNIVVKGSRPRKGWKGH